MNEALNPVLIRIAETLERKCVLIERSIDQQEDHFQKIRVIEEERLSALLGAAKDEVEKTDGVPSGKANFPPAARKAVVDMFGEAFFSDTLEFVSENVDPDDVFSDEALSAWAFENDFKRPGEPDS